LSLPDQIHIDRIRERLWCGRDIGQASVMIGAGFSRNAIKVVPNAPDLPLWNRLTDELKAQLKSTSSDPLRLAREYEVVFKRQSLDDLLISLIPDLQHQPGKLHKLLLSLPWSDVFTTNYDTLLERTTPFIYDRKYDLVLTHSDLPGKMKPRIVKLHGSLPSHRPFILTEEDYRTYPKKFAPFVNTVQQSIMENIFCLIGFSGDDQNFLNWIGWVRDNLGESTPPIYLCGLLNLSISQKQLLATKNVTTIDLSPLFPESDCLDRNTRHALSIEWFLLNLMQGQPTTNIYWPEPPTNRDLQKWEPSANLPELPDQTTSTWNHTYRSSDSHSRDEIKKLINNWKICREGYPGFVICPRNSRNALWRFTDLWIIPISRCLDKFSTLESLSVLYEINWRFEKSLTPLLYADVLVKIEDAVSKINPSPNLIEYSSSNSFFITPSVKTEMRDDKIVYIDWDELIIHWVELVFTIIKDARRSHNIEKFNDWIVRIKSIVNTNQDWRSRWFYEQCLFELVSLNKNKLDTLVKEWQVLDLSSIWLVRLSGINDEIGQTQKAEELARRALSDIRSRLRPYITDYSLLSQEGLAMMCLEIIERKNDWRKQLDLSNRDRWELLSIDKCDPRLEFEQLQNLFDRPAPQPKPSKQETIGFDPGTISTSRHWGEEALLSDLRPAFEFAMMMEECGMSPMMFHNSTPKAVQWIIPHTPLWGIEILIRCHNKKEVDKFFDCIFVETLEDSDIKLVYNWLVTRLNDSIKRMRTNQSPEDYSDSAWTQFNISLEILSRILSRISDESSIELLNSIIRHRSDALDEQILQLSDTIQSFWKRIFERISNIEIANSIESLLKISLPGGQTHNANSFEPFIRINWKEDFILPEGFDRSGWDLEISRLISNVSHGCDISREYSLLRLLVLLQIDALKPDEQSNLAFALWSKLDDNGLPSFKSVCLRKSALLHFPESIAGNTAKILKTYITSTEIPLLSLDTSKIYIISNYIDELINCGSHQLLHSHCFVKNRIYWEIEEIHLFLSKILLSINIPSIFESERNLEIFGLDNLLRKIVEFITLFVLPRWQHLDDKSKKMTIDILGIVRKAEYFPCQLSLCYLFITQDRPDEYSQGLTDKLYSNNTDAIEDACQAIYIWFVYDKSGLEIIEPSFKLIDNMISLFISRRWLGLSGYIINILRLMVTIPDLLDTERLNRLISGVRYILDETNLGNRKEISNSTIPRSEYRWYRGQVYHIARELDLIYSIRFPDLYPPILSEWKEASSQEIWSEIRNIW
jgi:SIR2-like domain